MGGRGTILKSTDGGDTWEARSNGTTAPLGSVTFAADGRTGWAVGDEGTILKSTDGGDTWQARPSGTMAPLYSVTFAADGRTGWAVGDEGTILKSTDGGDTWQARPSGTMPPLYSVTFAADGRTGWAVGLHTILKSIDGGDTWKAPASGTIALLYSVTFAHDGRTGWAVGNEGTILKSIDGGDTWQARPSGTMATLYSVTFAADGRTGWAVGLHTILKSIDGGDTWEAPSSGTIAWLYSVTFAHDGRTGWAVGEEGTILKSIDGGDTWDARSSGATVSLESVTFADDDRTGWAVGNDGSILKSIDGGDTWEERSNGTTASLESVTFAADGRTGWAVGDEGTILKSIDGGDTWEERSNGTTASLESVTFAADGRTGWAVGDEGTILKSTDGGDTWQARPSGNMAPLYSVAFDADGRTGFAVGGRGGGGFAGTILKSIDGGDTWEARNSGTTDTLLSVTFDDDGRTGWAGGGGQFGGIILKSIDGGDTWETRALRTVPFGAVTFTANGRTGWAVGLDGAILKSIDGGDTWQERSSGTTDGLKSVTFAADGRTGWAVGQGGTILKSIDGGDTWRGLNAKDDYRKYPAPWTWVLFALAIPTLVPVFRHPPPAEPATGIADHFISDRPIAAGDPDPLQRRSIANALSRFLRNENTEPPLTIAITGDWGDGKSSLMNLVQEDMKKHGTRTVTFNAWHHQKERHLFAALIQAVRDQAIPPLWTLRGLEFRGRLVLSRARRHPVWTIVALLFAGISVGTLGTDSNWMIEMFRAVPILECFDNELIKFLPSTIAGAIPLIVGLNSCFASLKGSAVNPGRLIAATSGVFRVKGFDQQLGFRHRFSDAFNEVTEALRPNTLLILIDDLDRCRPEQVVEILEAMNFLGSAGRCYIVIGIAPEQVEHCVGLVFKEIAAEMAEISNDGGTPEVSGRAKRRLYARNYLEKLINIEIPVPKLTDADAEKLAASGSAMKRGELRGALRHFSKVFKAAAVILVALGTGIYLASWMFQTAPQPTDPQQTSPAVPTQPGTPPVREAPQDTSTEVDDTQVDRSPSSFRPSPDDKVPWWSSHLPAWSLVFAAIVAMMLLVLRRQEGRIQDSRDFVEALRIWHPLIRATTNSPRQMKRFINRVRYLAMASSVSGKSPSTPGILDRIRRLPRVSNRALVEGPEEVQDKPVDTIERWSESQLIALSTLQDLERDVVLASLRGAEENVTAESGSIRQALDKALRRHIERFGKPVTEAGFTCFSETDFGILVH